MSRLIGGDFELDGSLLRLPARFDVRTAFASGRGALHAVVIDASERRGVRHVLLPDYLCRSMITAVEDAGCTYDYYPIGDDLVPDTEAAAALAADAGVPCAIVFVDYFGLGDPLAGIERLDAVEPRPVVVLDRAQAALRFDLPAGADYAFTDFRKSLPAPDGAPVLAREGAVGPSSPDVAPFVAEKLEGRLLKARAEAEGLADEAFLSHLVRGERLLDEDERYDYRMSDASASVLAGLDMHAARTRRRENFALLARLIDPLGLAPLRPLAAGDVPLVLPTLVADRDRVRAALASGRIFCPNHWARPEGVRLEPPDRDGALWTRELSLVIDQRYGAAEMEKTAAALAEALGAG